ncbi:MAG: peptidoglycan DD-metalloendopeptidase family protein [Gallionellaceae bacterium]
MLTQNTLTQERKLKLRWFVTLSTVPLLGVVTAFGIVPQTNIDNSFAKTVVEGVVLPNLTQAPDKNSTYWRSEQVQRGDTVDAILHRLNVQDRDASDFLRKDTAAEFFRQLDVGKEVRAVTRLDGSLQTLRFIGNSGNQVSIVKDAGGFQVNAAPPQVEQRILVRSGVINSSLYAATDGANLPDEIANQLIDIFGGDIDFHRDLHKGDKFTVTYEMTYSNGEPLRVGRIQAAEFINQGKSYRAVYFQADSKHGDYYTPQGKSMHKAFLRSPVEFSRISSGFSSARFHPILQKWRSHKGVDYAAPIGTKVKVTADGTVSYVGQQTGYGNVIMVEHQRRYTTVYGHLSRFANGLHRGERVNQGDVIGYVGMTGWATGPHLHYEFRIDGEQHDPLQVALPSAAPISSRQMAAFQEATGSLIGRLDLLHNSNLALLD